MQVGRVARGFGSGLLERRIAIDEDGEHAEAAAELDVGPRVANDGTGFGGDVGEFCLGLVEQAGKRLAAVAVGLVVGAKVERVDVGVVRVEFVLEYGVDVEDICRGVEVERDAALVGDDEDAHASAIQLRDGLMNAGQRLELVGRSDEAAFGHLLVDHAVAIEEDGVQSALRIAAFRGGHPAMIPTG